MRLALALMLGGTAMAAGTALPSKVISQAAPVMRLGFEDGYVKWSDPFGVRTVTGAMTVDVYNDWVAIKTVEGKLHVVPRDSVLYIGTWHLDEQPQ